MVPAPDFIPLEARGQSRSLLATVLKLQHAGLEGGPGMREFGGRVSI